MPTVRLSYQTLAEQPAQEIVRAIELADELGFYACYAADETYHKDAWQLMALAATRTKQIRLGPGVAPILLRDPALIAQAAATLDELSGGRAEVVISTGNFALLEQHGIEAERRPLGRLREAHAVIRMLLDTGELDFAGDFYRYSGLFTAARPVQERVPVKLGGMRGPRSFELAGEISDGLLTACAYSPEAVRFAADHLAAGALASGRDPSSLDLGDCVACAISTDGESARAAARAAAAFYIPSMPAELLERHGLEPERVAPIVDAFRRGEVAGALRLATPDITDPICIAGTPEEWVERIRADFIPNGMTHLVLVVIDSPLVESWCGVPVDVPNTLTQLRLIAEQVLPELS